MRFFSQMFIHHVSTAVTLSFLLIPLSAMAGPTLSVQGRIVSPNGSVLEASSVQFKVRIVSPNANACVLYEETQTKDLTGSGGLFSLSLNDGSGVRSDGLGHAFEKTFSNQSSFSVPSSQCATGSGTVTYTPAAGDERKVYIFFRESNALPWEQMPVMTLAHTSYALEAMDSSKVGGFAAANMCRVVDGSNNPVSVSALTSTQFNELLNVAQGNYTKTNANGASVIPSIAGNPGSGLAAGQLWYDTSSNQLKYYDGSVKSVGSGGGGVSSVVAGSGLLGGSITSTGTLSVDVGTTAGKIVQMQTGDKLPAVDGSALTNLSATQVSAGTLPVSRGGTGSGTALANNKVMVSSGGAIVEGYGYSTAYTANSFVLRDASGDFAAGAGTFYSTILKGATSGSLTITVPSTVTSYTLKWPAAAGSAGSFLTTDASGNLSWGSPTAVGDTSFSAKGIVQFNTDAATSGISLSGGVATVNYGTGANQIVKLDASSKLPAVDGSQLTNLSVSQVASGTLPVSKGGTGSATALTNNKIMISSGGAIVEGNGFGSSKAANTFVTRDASGNFAAGAGTFDSLKLNGATSGTLTLTAPSSFTSFSLNLPSADGSAGQFLKTDGAGNLTWGTATAPGDSTYSAKGIVQFNTDAATSGISLSSGVATVNYGTGANQIVKLDGSSKLPAVDGSALTNLSASNISSGTLGISRGGTGATSKTSAFDALSPTTTKGDLIVSDGTNNIRLPRGSDGQVLTTDSAQTAGVKWSSINTGTVTSVTGGTGLTGGTITSTGTLAVDVGTGANQIVQLNASSKLPAVDGSQLTNLSASQISSGTLPISKGGTGNSSFAGHAVIVSDLTGSQLQALNCASGQVLTFDSSGYAVCGNGGALEFLNGGNSFAGAATLGTNDNNTLSFKTFNTTRMTIDTSGNVGIGKTNPGALLDVKGEIRMSGATSGYAGLKSPAAGPSITWTLPSVDGSSGQFLKTDGSGNLTWGTASTVTDGSYSTKGILQADTDAATSGLAFNGSGVLKVNYGTGVNQIVKLDGSSRLPAVDGSQLTSLNAANISSGTLPIARGGTNSVAALNNNRIMVSSGGAIVEAGAMTNGQLLIGSTAAAPVVASLGSSNGISITTGAGSLSIATNATNANTASTIVSRDASGDFAAHDVTVNNLTASGTLTITGDVNAGAMRAGKQVSASSYSGSSDAINWNNGNIQTTSSNCQALSFTNLQDGGSYTLVVTDTATTGCAFPATINGGTAVSWRGQPTLVAHTRTASSHTIYTMMRVGSIIYVSWITGF